MMSLMSLMSLMFVMFVFGGVDVFTRFGKCRRQRRELRRWAFGIRRVERSWFWCVMSAISES